MRVIIPATLRLIAQAALVVGWSLCVYGQEGSVAPQVRLRDTGGRVVRLERYRGKVLLVNFWATWCLPCRAEMPELVRLQRRYAGRGLQIVGITYPPQRRREVRRFVRELGINYPVLLGTSEASASFGVGSVLPVTLVIDRAGIVRERILGILEPEEFKEKIEPLLKPITPPRSP